MQYPLIANTWDEEEIKAIQSVIKSDRYTMGAKVAQFEKDFSEYFGCQEAVMVNSGSTANLLIFALLSLKYKLKGDVIVPAVGWSTTYFPVNQHGFALNFVDIDKETLNIDPGKIESAITPNTKAIFAVNMLGNTCDYIALKQIAEKYNLMILEDNCESLGATTNTNEYAGTVGQLGSFSFFTSHHLQTMEGGMIACKDKNDADFIRSLRAHGWCRDLPQDNNLYKKTGDDFRDSFTFVTPGYNVRPLEISGAVGIAQLKKWPRMKEKRIKNAEYFQEKFRNMDCVMVQKEVGSSSWFGFSLVLKGKLNGRRDLVIEQLTENGVETRPIVAGNFMRNPVMKYLDYIDNKNYEHADQIHNNGFFVGNNTSDLKENIDLVHQIISMANDRVKTAKTSNARET